MLKFALKSFELNSLFTICKILLFNNQLNLIKKKKIKILNKRIRKIVFLRRI